MFIIKQLTKKQILYLLLIIIWMVVVFVFSNQPAEKSSKTSGSITEKVVKVIVKKPEEIPQNKLDTIETVVRKSAHFVLYFIGGFLVINFINTTNTTNKRKVIYAITFATMYACTDEIHQYFVEGRSCELRDVVIDALGASVGMMQFLIIKKLRRK